MAKSTAKKTMAVHDAPEKEATALTPPPAKKRPRKQAPEADGGQSAVETETPEAQTPPESAPSPPSVAVRESPEPMAETLAAPDRAEEKEIETPLIESREQATRVLECLLFTTTEPLPLRKLQRMMRPYDVAALEEILIELKIEYEGRGLQIMEVAGGLLMATRPEYADWVTALHKNRRRRPLTRAMLETLAIIAYRQPIIKAEIDSIRGVDSVGVVRALFDMELVDARDRREVIGRPLQYRTTKDFLKAFGLKSLSSLPTIGELRDLYRKKEQEEAQAPIAEAETTTLEGLEDEGGEDETGIAEGEERATNENRSSGVVEDDDNEREKKDEDWDGEKDEGDEEIEDENEDGIEDEDE